MVTALMYLALLILVVAGLVALGTKRTLSEEEYESRRGKGSGIGNALLALHDLLEPQRGQAGEARQERRAEKEPPGDPPEPGGPAGSDAGGPG